MSIYPDKEELKQMLSQDNDTNSGVSIPGWPVFWWIILCAGEPDLLDAIIRLLGNF